MMIVVRQAEKASCWREKNLTRSKPEIRPAVVKLDPTITCKVGAEDRRSLTPSRRIPGRGHPPGESPGQASPPSNCPRALPHSRPPSRPGGHLVQHHRHG